MPHNRRAVRVMAVTLVCLCLAAAGQAEALPGAITEAILSSGQSVPFDVLDSLVVENDWAACVLSSQGQNTLYTLEYTDGQWAVTAANSRALYPDTPLRLVRYTPGGWRYDGFLVQYNTTLGEWPYFAFDRLGYGQWALNIFMLQDGYNLWRIDRDPNDVPDRWIFTDERDDVKMRFEAFRPFDPNLATLDASQVPVSLEAAQTMLGGALVWLSETPVQPYIKPTSAPTPQPLPYGEYLQGELVSFPPGEQYAAYSGPGTSYLSGDGGNAAVSTDGPITLYGVENGYALISYRVGSDTARFGYIDASYLPDPSLARPLAFYRYPIVLPMGAALTDDPDLSGRTFFTLDTRASGEYLITYGSWAYVETWDSQGNPVRGFIPDSEIVYGSP